MSGVNEILIVVAIIAGIFFVPRMLPAKRQIQIAKRPIVFSGKLRLAVAASIIYPLAAAAYFKPWKNDIIVFLYLGIGPVALCWLLTWVLGGRKFYHR